MRIKSLTLVYRAQIEKTFAFTQFSTFFIDLKGMTFEESAEHQQYPQYAQQQQHHGALEHAHIGSNSSAAGAGSANEFPMLTQGKRKCLIYPCRASNPEIYLPASQLLFLTRLEGDCLVLSCLVSH